MPRLLAFLPCERAIISRDDGSVTLVQVFHGYTVGIPEQALGQRALLPIRWSVLTYWLREAGDENAQFEQLVELVSGDGETLLTQESQFTIAKQTHSQVGQVLGFPVPSARQGDIPYSLRVSLRRIGQPDYQLVAEYPIVITLAVASSERVSR